MCSVQDITGCLKQREQALLESSERDKALLESYVLVHEDTKETYGRHIVGYDEKLNDYTRMEEQLGESHVKDQFMIISWPDYGLISQYQLLLCIHVYF